MDLADGIQDELSIRTDSLEYVLYFYSQVEIGQEV